MPIINFFSEDLVFKVPFPRKTAAWIRSSIRKEKKHLRQINFIFCSDEYLLEKNISYLNHKTLTDVITFNNSDDEGMIEGDVFISVDRIRANAEAFQTDFVDELNRVMIHGVLHLIGYADKTIADKSTMRKKEDAYLSLRS